MPEYPDGTGSNPVKKKENNIFYSVLYSISFVVVYVLNITINIFSHISMVNHHPTVFLDRLLCGSFMFLFCLVFAMFCARLFICASWSPAGKGLTSWLSFVVSSVSLSLSHWYPGSGVVLDCIDS